MTSYRAPFEQPGFLHTLNRILSAYIRVGTFFGVEVRLLWITVIIFPLITLSGVSDLSGSAFWTGASTLAWIIVLPASLMLIIYSHEVMHIVAGWRYRIHTPLITLSPLGGLAHMDAPAPNPKAEIVISLAGPAVHLAWLAVCWPLSSWIEPSTEPVQFFVWLYLDVLVSINLVLMIFNLLPFYPMDGGRVLRAILSLRMHPNRATILVAHVGRVGAIGIGIYGLLMGGLYAGIMIAIAITNFLACGGALRAARSTAGPYQQMQAPWAGDADWWKRGDQASAGAPRRPGLLGRLSERRRQRRAEAHSASMRALDEEVDRVLERVSKVGLPGLTDNERKILERASKARRKTGG